MLGVHRLAGAAATAVQTVTLDTVTKSLKKQSGVGNFVPSSAWNGAMTCEGHRAVFFAVTVSACTHESQWEIFSLLIVPIVRLVRHQSASETSFICLIVTGCCR